MGKFENIISLGYYCEVAEFLTKNQIRNGSYPFDWIITKNLEDIYRCMSNHFQDFLNSDYLLQSKINPSYYKNENYSFYFFHDFVDNIDLTSQLPQINVKYNRRINRLYENITKPTLFIRIVNQDSDSSDITFLKEHSKDFEDFIKSFNSNNEIIYIYIDKNHKRHIKANDFGYYKEEIFSNYKFDERNWLKNNFFKKSHKKLKILFHKILKKNYVHNKQY